MGTSNSDQSYTLVPVFSRVTSKCASRVRVAVVQSPTLCTSQESLCSGSNCVSAIALQLAPTPSMKNTV